MYSFLATSLFATTVLFSALTSQAGTDAGESVSAVSDGATEVIAIESEPAGTDEGPALGVLPGFDDGPSVPEPGVYGLLGTVVVGIAVIARRRRQNHPIT